MSYNKIKFAVGLFVLIFTIILLVFSFLLLKEKGVFEKKESYNFDVESARSFSVGMPLQLSGFDIGVIEKIKLKDNGKVNIIFSVSKKNQKWINKKTYLMIKKPLIGSPHIEVHSELGLAPLAKGAKIKMITSDDINDMIAKLEPVVTKLTNIIDSVETITHYLASKDSEFVHILKNFDTFSNRLLKDDALLTTITGDKEATKSVVDSLNATPKMMQKVGNIIDDLGKISASLEADIVKPSSQSIQELNKILQDVEMKLKTINATVKSVGSYDKDLLQLKDEVSVAIKKSNKIIDKVDGLLDDDTGNRVVLP